MTQIPPLIHPPVYLPACPPYLPYPSLTSPMSHSISPLSFVGLAVFTRGKFTMAMPSIIQPLTIIGIAIRIIKNAVSTRKVILPFSSKDIPVDIMQFTHSVLLAFCPFSYIFIASCVGQGPFAMSSVLPPLTLISLSISIT